MGIEKGTRYTLAEKERRNQEVRDYKAAHPEATQRQMAEIFGLSHVRIGKILKGSNGVVAG